MLKIQHGLNPNRNLWVFPQVFPPLSAVQQLSIHGSKGGSSGIAWRKSFEDVVAKDQASPTKTGELLSFHLPNTSKSDLRKK
jgi:hypothetical protein